MKQNPKFIDWGLAVWEYLGELILALLLAVLTFVLAGVPIVAQRTCALRGDLMLAVGGVLSLSATVWVGFFALLVSKFGSWLRSRGQASAYAKALATPILADLIGFILLLLLTCPPSTVMIRLVLFVLFYDLINVVTMIRNVIGLISLWEIFRHD